MTSRSLFRLLLLCLLPLVSEQSGAADRLVLGSEKIAEPTVHALLAGQRIGVLTHHAARDSQGTHLVDRLVRDGSLNLKMIFAPEHGYRSVDDVLLPDTRDAETGLPVYSLYGPRKGPTPEMLSQIDVILVELQDVGLRYYTYPATVVHTLRAAKQAGKRVILLDRPNPLGGEKVDGAQLEPELANGGLTSIAPIPTRHGMTLGELASYLNERLNIRADLTVVPMAGWSRSFHWKETGLNWVPSSPALLNEEQIFLYSFLGTLESVDLAVGRGLTNERAFQDYGAPWITESDQARLIPALNALKIPRIRFESVTWTPNRARHLGHLCRGFRIQILSGTPDLPMSDSISVYLTLEKVLGSKIDFDRGVTMLGGRWLARAIEAQSPVESTLIRIRQESVRFQAERRPFLLY